MTLTSVEYQMPSNPGGIFFLFCFLLVKLYQVKLFWFLPEGPVSMNTGSGLNRKILEFCPARNRDSPPLYYGFLLFIHQTKLYSPAVVKGYYWIIYEGFRTDSVALGCRILYYEFPFQRVNQKLPFWDSKNNGQNNWRSH